MMPRPVPDVMAQSPHASEVTHRGKNETQARQKEEAPPLSKMNAAGIPEMKPQWLLRSRRPTPFDGAPLEQSSHSTAQFTLEQQHHHEQGWIIFGTEK